MKPAVLLFLAALPATAQTNVVLSNITYGGGVIPPPDFIRDQTNQGQSTIQLAAAKTSRPYGLPSRPESKPFLFLPPRADGVLPPLLSQTGAFKDTVLLSHSDGLIPYDLIVPFWSDGATKSRWIGVQSGASIKFAASGEWVFPAGTVFVKTFELATDEKYPNQKRRLETRLLVCDEAGGVYGVVYKWRADNSDADLLATNLTEAISIRTSAGARSQMWYYPSRQDCVACHTANAGGVLGVKTRQLN